MRLRSAVDLDLTMAQREQLGTTGNLYAKSVENQKEREERLVPRTFSGWLRGHGSGMAANDGLGFVRNLLAHYKEGDARSRCIPHATGGVVRGLEWPLVLLWRYGRSHAVDEWKLHTLVYVHHLQVLMPFRTFRHMFMRRPLHLPMHICISMSPCTVLPTAPRIMTGV